MQPLATIKGSFGARPACFGIVRSQIISTPFVSTGVTISQGMLCHAKAMRGAVLVPLAMLCATGCRQILGIHDREPEPFANLEQRSYVKASNTDGIDSFGHTIALSDDGSTLAVGAFLENSTATTIDGDQLSNAYAASGAVYVFTRTSDGWAQQAYIKASNNDGDDRFGVSVSLSHEGSTLAVGAEFEDAGGQNSGAAYVYSRAGVTWSEQAILRAQSPGAEDHFGARVAISGDGTTLAVAAPQEAGGTRGIGGNQSDNSAPKAGAVYVFGLTGTTWTQDVYLKASNADVDDLFGTSLAISGDGATLAVGAPGEASGASGIGGNEADNAAKGAGAVYVFRRGMDWTQDAYVKSTDATAAAEFGSSVALNKDGSCLAVGAHFESTIAIHSGAGYVFTRGASWMQRAKVKASTAGASDELGASVVLSSDATTLVIGAIGEASKATGIDGDETDDTAVGAGAVYMFGGDGDAWTERAYVKASNTDARDAFGTSLAIDGAALMLVVGAAGEASGGRGIAANPADNTAFAAGAAYVFQW